MSISPGHSLAYIAALLNVDVPAGAGDRRVTGVATLTEAGETDISMLVSDAYRHQYPATRAAAVIVHRKVQLPAERPTPALVVDDAEKALARVLELFAPPVPQPPFGIDPLASVASSAVIAEDVRIGPHVFIGERARIGRGSCIHPGAYIGDDTRLGEDCRIFPNVVIRERITLGHRVVIHAGTFIGSDGFGYYWDGQRHAKIPQIGTVVIEDDVEIGSCVCIDRAKMGSTRIGQGTKIDNLVQIAHNVQIGRHCILLAQVGIGGSTVLGNGVVLAGKTAVRDHIHIGDGAIVAACSAIPNDIPAGQTMAGMPTLPHRQWLREQAAIRRLPELVIQIRKLQEQVDKLTAAKSELAPPKTN